MFVSPQAEQGKQIHQHSPKLIAKTAHGMHFNAPCAVCHKSACFLIFQCLSQIVGSSGKLRLSFLSPVILSSEYDDYHDCYHNYQNCQPYEVAYSHEGRADVAEAAFLFSACGGRLLVGDVIGRVACWDESAVFYGCGNVVL